MAIDALDTTPPSAGETRGPRTGRLGTWILLALVTAVIIAGAALVRSHAQQDAAAQTGGVTVNQLASGAPKVGDRAPDFTVTTYDGRQVSLASLKGRGVWLNFGASWCTGCQAEIADIEAAHKKWTPRGVTVLGINITEDTAAVKSYAERIGITFPIAPDPQSKVAGAFGVSSIPAHVFVDADGVIRDIRPGGLTPATMDEICGTLATTD